MKERGIIMRDWEVRAIREGRKTQKRVLAERFIKPSDYRAFLQTEQNAAQLEKLANKCTLGMPGDGLWVKEAVRFFNSTIECACYDACSCSKYNGKPIYRADNFDSDVKWTPSIHMPRWASRITLKIVSVRAQRLQDITEDDVIAEGCAMDGVFPKEQPHQSGIGAVGWDSAVEWYSDLWESINGPGSWERNDFVFAVEFKEKKP